MQRTRKLIPVVLLVGAVALAACGSDDTDDAQPANEPGQILWELPETIGCGEAFFAALTADDTRAVTVSVEERDRSTTKPTVITFEVGDPDVAIRVFEGRGLKQSFCNDVIDGNTYKVESELGAVSGHGRIELDPRPTSPAESCGSGNGSLVLEDLVDEDGRPYDDITVTTNDIGCYAG